MRNLLRKTSRSGITSSAAPWKLLAGASASAVLLAGAAWLAPAASAAALAPSAAAPTATVVQAGGMVLAGTAVAQSTTPAVSYPSCHSIKYVGDAGFISVQEKSGRLAWGITMTPLSYSIGKWSVSTYLSGKKTTSGFNRTVTIGYIPHGSLSVPSGKIFHVMAEVVGPNGTFVNVPNACRT